MNTKAKGYLLGAVAAATYGMNPLFALPLYKAGMDPDSVLFFRYLFAIPLLGTMLKARGRDFKLHRREIVPLVLGSPLWLSLGLAAIAVIFAFYVVLWSVSVSLWAVFASLAVCAVGGLPAFAVLIARSGAAALAILAAGMVCAGLPIFLFFGRRAATKGILTLTRRIASWLKHCFLRKKDAQ